jgi:hypothetical protein
VPGRRLSPEAATAGALRAAAAPCHPAAAAAAAAACWRCLPQALDCARPAPGRPAAAAASRRHVLPAGRLLRVHAAQGGAARANHWAGQGRQNHAARAPENAVLRPSGARGRPSAAHCRPQSGALPGPGHAAAVLGRGRRGGASLHLEQVLCRVPCPCICGGRGRPGAARGSQGSHGASSRWVLPCCLLQCLQAGCVGASSSCVAWPGQHRKQLLLLHLASAWSSPAAFSACH